MNKKEIMKTINREIAHLRVYKCHNVLIVDSKLAFFELTPKTNRCITETVLEILCGHGHELNSVDISHNGKIYALFKF